MQTLVRKFSSLVDIQGWSANKVLARKSDNSGFEWVDLNSGGTLNQVNSDWNAISGVAQILNKPSFAQVATSGSYNDLINKPTIPSQYTDAMAINALSASLGLKVDKVSGKVLSSNDYTDAEKNKLGTIASGAEVNVNADWNAVTGDALILNKPSIPTQYTDAMAQSALSVALNLKVDKVTGKSLSSNDFTDTLKTKLDGIASGAEVNVNADWNAISGDAQILNKPTIPTSSSEISYTDPVFNTVKLALDQHSNILTLLAPAPPPNLSSLALSIANTYTAKESSTGTVRSNVINSQTPTANVTSAFYNGDTGTLTAVIDNVVSGSKVLTTSDDTGVYSSLRILSDADTYAGQFGKQGFYKQLTASIVPTTSLSLKVAHVLYMQHSVTGSTQLLTIHCDSPSAPSISSQSVTGVTHTSLKKISGIPCLTTGDTIQAQCSASNTVSSFYNNNQIIKFSGAQISTLNFTPITPPTSGAIINSGNQNLTVSSGDTNSAVITCTAYNSANTTGSANITSTNIRISTSITESGRVKSGTTDMPLSGYGAAYDSSELLTANAELQLDVDSNYKYPPAINYSSHLPSGPNYATGLGTSDRYVTFNLGSFSGTSKVVNINNATNFGSSILISGIKMYAKVQGATGWVDINAAYPGVGNPTNDGDPALVISNSSVTSRSFTFGSIVKTGTLYIRIALPYGSNKTFSGIS